MSTIQWKTDVNGDWSNQSDWSGNAVPAPGDDVILGAAGTYTVTVSADEAADNLTLSDLDATLAINAVLSVGGGIDGGTIDMTVAGSTLAMTAGQTIDNETIDIGRNGSVIDPAAFLYGVNSSSPGSVVTLGKNSTIVQAGRVAVLGSPSTSASAGIDNQGMITVGYGVPDDYGTMVVTSGSFTNDTTGVITVSNNNTLYIVPGSPYYDYPTLSYSPVGKFANAGKINVTTGGQVFLPPGWSNTGTIAVSSDGSVVLEGSFTTAELSGFDYSGGRLDILGTLDNTGATLNIPATASTTLELDYDGTIIGGTINDSSGNLLIASDNPSWGGPVLDDVTLQGTLDLRQGGTYGYDSLVIEQGLRLVAADGIGPGQLDINRSTLDVDIGVTLDNAEIKMGNDPGYFSNNSIVVMPTTSQAGIVTFGKNLIVFQGDASGGELLTSYGASEYGLYQGYDGLGIDNQGTIDAGSTANDGGRYADTNFVINLPLFTNDTTGVITASSADKLLVYDINFENKGAISVKGVGTVVTFETNTSVRNDGIIRITTGGIVIATTLNGSGGIAIGDASTLELEAPTKFFNQIAWSIGGVIDLAKTDVKSAKIIGHELVITPTTGSAFSYDLSGTYAPDETPVTGTDHNGGTTLTLEEEPPCFLTGTRILTTRGDTAVEDLREGDLVLTANGRAAPVRWVGCSRFDLTTIRNRSHFRPIRIRRDAIALGMPARELLVSRGHALYVDGVLVPALYLLNGASIVEDRSFVAVTYYHVELDRHDILIADGMPAESYLDTGNRHLFESSVSLSEGGGESCAPVVQAGDALLRIRAAIAARIEAGQTRDPDPYLLADGVAVAPLRRTGKTYRFALSDAPWQLRLMSRANIAPRIGAVPDMRMFGVAVTEVVLRAPGVTRALDLTDPDLTGFSWSERSGDGTAFRWTDGDAVLPASLWQGVGAFTLDVTVSATVPYWIPTQAFAMAV